MNLIEDVNGWLHRRQLPLVADGKNHVTGKKWTCLGVWPTGTVAEPKKKCIGWVEDGRDLHGCSLRPKHDGKCKCKCGVWGNPI